MHISLAAEKIFHLGSFPVTNSLINSLLISIFLIVFFLLVVRQRSLVPKGIYNAVEGIFEVLLNFMDTVTADRKKSIRFFPLVATLFIFIMASNWFGLFPGIGTIGFWEEHQTFVPLFRSANSDLNSTLALALISVIATQIFGIVILGFFQHLKKYIHWNPIKLFIGMLEMLGEIAKMLSFSFRLFGNIFAGEVLLTVVAVLIPFIAPLPFYFLELFVGFIQALVFAMLTLVFLQIATTEAH